MSYTSGSNGNWDRWVAHEIGGLKATVIDQGRQIETNRRAAFRETWLVRRELLGRFAHMERSRRFEWMWRVPWFKITVLLILAILVMTGHITGAELKAWAMKKIAEF